MQYQKEYHSPLGRCCWRRMTRVWSGSGSRGRCTLDGGWSPGARRGAPLLSEAERWLDCYFSGHEPEFQPPIHWSGTPFQQTVGGCCGRSHTGPPSPMENWPCVREQLGRPGMSAQAVGGAVARNPISVLVPCHRVVGADGSLTGYAGGLERKRRLLDLEAAGENLPRSGGLGGKLTGGTVILKRAVLFYFSRISSASFSSHSSSVAA